MTTTRIAVYADWAPLHEPTRLGFLHARQGSGREAFSFEFDPTALSLVQALPPLDSILAPFEGPQYLPRGADTFGGCRSPRAKSNGWRPHSSSRRDHNPRSLNGR